MIWKQNECVAFSTKHCEKHMFATVRWKQNATCMYLCMCDWASVSMRVRTRVELVLTQSSLFFFF